LSKKVTNKISCDYFSQLNIGYDEWFKKPFSNYVRRRQVKNFLEFSDGCENFLEVGCGTGKFISLAKCKNKSGVDISSEMINISKKKCPDTNFYVATSNNLPFQDNIFDRVVMLNVFQYIENPEATIDELIRVTRLGGRILFTVFSKNSISLNPFRFYIRRKFFGENLPQVVFYRKNEIIRMLTDKNFFIKGSGLRPPFESKALFNLSSEYLDNYEDTHQVHPLLTVEMFVYLTKQ
jgi:ubiquinone/menaquinone biosynthesis C-methylase UbiE